MMTENELLHHFPWFVPKRGMRWADAIEFKLLEPETGREGRYLIFTAPEVEKDRRFRHYMPLERHTGLFHLLADLPLTEAAMLAFAKRYGPFEWAHMPEVVLRGASRRPGLKVYWGQPLEDLRSKIAFFQSIVKLADLAQRDDPALADLINIDSNEILYLGGSISDGTEQVRDGKVVTLVAADWWQAKDYATLSKLGRSDIAKEVVTRAGNVQLKAGCPIQHVREDFDSPAKAVVSPDSLLAALWWQFSDSIARGAEFRECATCAEPFDLSLGRSDRRYCSDSCRVRAVQLRKSA